MTAAVAAYESARVLAAGVMSGIADMALAIACLIAVEVIEGLLAAIRHGSGVSVAGVIPIIDVAIEAGVTVIPRTSADEDASVEPVGTIVAVGGAVVRSVVVVAVGASRCGADANTDGNLGRGHRTRAYKGNGKS